MVFNLWQRGQSNGEKTVSSINGTGEMGIPICKKNEIRTLSNTIHKNKND